MRAQRQADDDRHSSARGRSRRAATAPRAAGRSGAHNPLPALQQTAGNAATVAALNAAGPSAARRRPPRVPPAIAEVEDDALELPPYLRDMEAAGLSTAYGLAGHAFVTTTLADVVGRRDGVVAEIAAELAGRPESFYGRGRAFAVTGVRGTDRYDVTVSVSPADDDRPGVLSPAGLDSEGAATKVDVQHNSAATVAHSTGASASKGAAFTAFGLAPVTPGVWLGGAATISAQPFQSSRDSRAQRNRMNQFLGAVDGSGSSTATAADAAGSIPLHKPKSESVLVQFTLDVRVVAEVSDRVRPGRRSTAVQEVTLPEPVVVRMPAPAVRRMLADGANAELLRDPGRHLTPAVPPGEG
ncbi:hypothetical protein [Streptomyces sp. NPDC005859]|uniref:hypothetical protein n=1 Tax=Streptomyces sp. NPDC005859 TaxID=3157170 RepID=UPI0033E9D278